MPGERQVRINKIRTDILLGTIILATSGQRKSVLKVKAAAVIGLLHPEAMKD